MKCIKNTLKVKNSINIKNKKASFEFTFLEEFVAGIVLLGTEVKSIRNGNANFVDSYCYIDEGEMFLKNLHISEYKNSSYNKHDPTRIRKLLLTRREINKIKQKISEKGLTVIPIKMFFNERGLIKISIAIAKGKKNWDKRESIKERDINREIQRNYER